MSNEGDFEDDLLDQVDWDELDRETEIFKSSLKRKHEMEQKDEDKSKINKTSIYFSKSDSNSSSQSKSSVPKQSNQKKISDFVDKPDQNPMKQAKKLNSIRKIELSSLNHEFDKIEVYSDGSCEGNPGPGGWGTVILFYNGEEVVSEIELGGYQIQTTNNQMEMTGALEGLKKLNGIVKKENKTPITMITDSNYVVKGMQEWLKVDILH
eukprot:TRINITY_DN5099_c0_g1_i1.p1 TRINITY_DN5099_c0_g1~~TRINITY_DN5099_c0_g1_i1.p1  ORF type:complete len:209 (-),score=82.05 TRINITY_DN5099_c0_g1_i1:262-888(-)